jgi:uncharacterized membrane protein
MNGLALPALWNWRLRGVRLPIGFFTTVVIGTLLLAGATHIVTILLVPSFAQSDGWSRLVAHAAENRFAEIAVGRTEPNAVIGLDPLFVNGACRIALGEAPAGITVAARDRFWSLALYDPRGNIIFSLNDRTAIEGQLDMIVANRAQNARLNQAPTGQLDQTIVVESGSNDLIAILRLFAPTRATQEEGQRILAEAECLPDPSVLPPLRSGA